MKHCHCVFPAPSEEELVTIPGDEPNVAWRLYMQASPEGYVRLQQLAWGDGLGWYVQKTMVLPRAVVTALVPQLRKALCLMPPARQRPVGGPIPFLRLTSEKDDGPVERVGG